MRENSSPSAKKRITQTFHGMRHTPEYHSWCSMKGRCLNPNNQAYGYYGKRGITICQEWVYSFPAFYRDMGPRPAPKHTLDRINNNGNYEPGNCRWATRKEQADNRRDWTSITFNGETRSVNQWAKHLNIPYQVLYHRLQRHPSDDILSMRLQPEHRRGESVKGSFLTEPQVREMRRLHAAGEANYSEIGRRFNINRRYARDIVTGRTWRHVL